MQEGIGMAKDDYASRGQYRDAAQQHLLHPTRPDLSGLVADSGNPYKRGRMPSVGGLPPAIPQAPQGPSSPAPPMPPPGQGPTAGRPIDPVSGIPPYQSPRARAIAEEIAAVGRGAAPPVGAGGSRIPSVGRY
jgi:hypothetical protein